MELNNLFFLFKFFDNYSLNARYFLMERLRIWTSRFSIVHLFLFFYLVFPFSYITPNFDEKYGIQTSFVTFKPYVCLYIVLSSHYFLAYVGRVGHGHPLKFCDYFFVQVCNYVCNFDLYFKGLGVSECGGVVLVFF